MSTPQTFEGLTAGDYAGATRLKLSSGLASFDPILTLTSTLTTLDLSGCALTTLPSTIASLTSLKILFLSNCQFETFPDLSRCANLEMVAFKSNGMTSVPEGVLPPKLKWLILTGNDISELPRSIGDCVRLQKCMLAGNQLTTLPDEMSKCRKLGLLRISANRIESLPEWLFTMPELSFMAFGGNPCAVYDKKDDPVLDDISWDQLQVETILGEGASGIISKAVWNRGGAVKHVAVKLFKGEVTSDGSPADEMAACIAAGQHANLIDPIAKIHGHPEKKGLVLELIPPIYTNLGLPPTLDSCTRDSFPATTVFSQDKVLRILKSIAGAAAHIHGMGISHGDLYAHNVLVREDGHSLLGDFGAASIYRRDHDKAEALEKLEVLAFAHLIEDMMGLVDAQTWTGETRAQLLQLHARCVDSVVSRRPLFEFVDDRLRAIAPLP